MQSLFRKFQCPRMISKNDEIDIKGSLMPILPNKQPNKQPKPQYVPQSMIMSASHSGSEKGLWYSICY